jgi:hypothetical protein
MQENGVPITYSYISDAHDSHTSPFRAFGPGEAGYVEQLAAADAAFDKFFTRLANDDINPSNTLFVLTPDEGDHFAGGPPLNAGCDGVTTPCTYTPGSSGPNTVGEILTNIQALLGEEDPTLDFNKTPFDIHFDMAPVFYLSGQPASASPRRGILLPICAVPGQTAPCAVPWARTPHDTYSPNWNALTFATLQATGDVRPKRNGQTFSGLTGRTSGLPKI